MTTGGAPFKLLVVSHACVTPVNQQLFADVATQAAWSVDIVVPASWKSDYGGRISPTRWPGFEGKLISLPVIGSGNIPLHAYRSRMARLLRRERPDAIYVHNEPYALSTAQVFAAARRYDDRVPVGFYAAQNLVKRYPPPFRQLEQRAYRQARFAFPCSKGIDDVLRTKGYAGPSTVLPLGIDPAVYRPHEDAPALRRELLGGEDGVLIGYLGRLVEEKGLITLLRGLAKVAAMSWRLALVGSGPFEAQIDAEARRLGIAERVRRVGFVPHERAPAYLSAFDLLALPSETRPHWKEQFGRVVIEALACGTPVLGSDSGEIPNLIADTGGGLVFREADAGDLAIKLNELLGDAGLRRRLAKAGGRAVTDRYTNATIAQRFADAVRAAAQ